mmetsp:Transcript_2231/g.2918  ORF Transcript_2231/g.2918 Transcript_2231/m.2918 type:complete len:251 (+) Transcript_2231:84-836(+)
MVGPPASCCNMYNEQSSHLGNNLQLSSPEPAAKVGGNVACYAGAAPSAPNSADGRKGGAHSGRTITSCFAAERSQPKATGDALRPCSFQQRMQRAIVRSPRGHRPSIAWPGQWHGKQANEPTSMPKIHLKVLRCSLQDPLQGGFGDTMPPHAGPIVQVVYVDAKAEPGKLFQIVAKRSLGPLCHLLHLFLLLRSSLGAAGKCSPKVQCRVRVKDIFRTSLRELQLQRQHCWRRKPCDHAGPTWRGDIESP